MLKKIISGGQTGADRAALDVALAQGYPCGGYCPAGRQAEDGPLPMRYPLVELGGGYRQRTRANVNASDATVLFYQGMPTGGTALTLAFCLKAKQPFKLIDRGLCDAAQAAAALQRFIDEYDVACLNVAGPRASQDEAIYAYVWEVLAALPDLRAVAGTF